jgi:hypothetical protein
MSALSHFSKGYFCRPLVDPLNPLFPSYCNVQKYPLVQSQWNHFSHFSYDQRYPRKVQLTFLEHFYFCLVVLLIVIVSDVSWRIRRSTRRWTRRIEDIAEPGKQPFDHDTPLLFIGIFPNAWWWHWWWAGFDHCIDPYPLILACS